MIFITPIHPLLPIAALDAESAKVLKKIRALAMNCLDRREFCESVTNCHRLKCTLPL